MNKIFIIWGLNMDQLKVKEKHCEMVNKLSDHLSPSIQDSWAKLKNKLSPHLSRVEICNFKDIFEVVDSLLQKGLIQYGSYNTLKNVVKSISVPVLEIVEEYESREHGSEEDSSTDTSGINKAGGDSKDSIDTVGTSTNTVNAHMCGGCDERDSNRDASACQQKPKRPETSASTTASSNRGDNLKLDYIAGELSTEIDEIGTYLDVQEPERNSIRQHYREPHEVKFHILLKWFRHSTGSSESKFYKLDEVLINVERTDITQYRFKSPDCTAIDINIENLDAEFGERDARYVSSQLSHSYMRLGRYLGLAEHKMEQIFIDEHHNVKEQAYQILHQARQANILRTRKDICNGLCYIQREDIIEMLNDKWKSSKK